MNEQPPPRDESPIEPFSAPPVGRGPKASGSSSILIGCGALFVLLGIGAIVALSRADDLFAWMMGRVESEVLANVAAEVPVDVRSDFRNAFAELIQDVRDQNVDPEHLKSVQRALLKVARKGKGEITEDDLVRLSRALRGEAIPELDQDTLGSQPRAPGEAGAH